MTTETTKKPVKRTDQVMGMFLILGGVLFVGGILWAAALVHPVLAVVVAGFILLAVVVIYAMAQS